MPKDTMRVDYSLIEVMDERMPAVLRAKTPAERLQIGFGLWASAQKMLQTHLTTQHPDWDAAHVFGRSRHKAVTWCRMNCWRVECLKIHKTRKTNAGRYEFAGTVRRTQCRMLIWLFA